MRPKLTRRRILVALFVTVLSGIAFLVAGGWAASRYYSFAARFGRSKPDLEAYAAQVMASDPSKPLPALPARLGAFQTDHVERLPHGFLFFCDYGHPLDANGLAYSTVPLPADVNQHDFFEHIEGNWYTMWRN
jgi:hypothetical protein